MKPSLFGIALEAESATGEAKREIEYVFYAKLVNKELLLKASHKENHDQWEIRLPATELNAGSGRIRIRKTMDDSGTSYVQTTKTPVVVSQSVSGLQEGDKETSVKKDIEVAIPSTEAAFEQFKIFASDGMLKNRYTFDIPGTGLKWEVDVFILPDGTESEWCKIDLEVAAPLETLPALPEGFDEVISNQRDAQTPEEKERIEWIYSNIIKRKNVFLDQKAIATEAIEEDTVSEIALTDIPDGDYIGTRKGYFVTFELEEKKWVKFKTEDGLRNISPIPVQFNITLGHYSFKD